VKDVYYYLADWKDFTDQAEEDLRAVVEWFGGDMAPIACMEGSDTIGRFISRGRKFTPALLKKANAAFKKDYDL
jgi:hypothetical protein